MHAHCALGMHARLALPPEQASLCLQVVSDPKDAEFLLAHGTECMGRGDGEEPVPTSLPEMRSLLQTCADLGGKPLIVANPDVITVRGKGLIEMPGTLANWWVQVWTEMFSTSAVC